MHCDLAQPWSKEVIAYDACPAGHASVIWEAPVEVIRVVGNWQGRWRYNEKGYTDSVRERALDLTRLGSAPALGCLPDREANHSFPEVDTRVLPHQKLS